MNYEKKNKNDHRRSDADSGNRLREGTYLTTSQSFKVLNGHPL